MDALTTNYDYSQHGSLAPVLQGFAKRIRDRIAEAHKITVDVGVTLDSARKQLKDAAAFEAWAWAEFEMRKSTAYKWAAIGRAFDGKKLADGGIEKTALYALSAADVPEAARDAAVEMANDGVNVTKAVADELIESHSTHLECEEDEGGDAVDDEPEIADADVPQVTEWDHSQDERPRERRLTTESASDRKLRNLMTEIRYCIVNECEGRDTNKILNSADAFDRDLEEFIEEAQQC